MRSELRLMLIIGILVVGTGIIVAVPAEAASSGGSCATVRFTNALGGYREWAFNVTGAWPEPSIQCAGAEFADVNGQFDIQCHQFTQAVIPGAPDTLRLRLVIDDTNFGSASPAAFYTRDFTLAECTTANPITVYCTDNGLAGGSPRYGIVRLHVRATLAGVGGYDVHSEDGQSTSLHGAFRCSAAATLLDDGASPPASTYVGGDTITTRVAFNRTTYEAGVGQLSVVCGSSTVVISGTVNPSPTTTSASMTIKGPVATWPDDCAPVVKWDTTKFSAITGFTDKAWVAYSSIPGGDTDGGGGDITSPTGRMLDRTLTEQIGANCPLVKITSLPGSPVRTSANRGQDVQVSCNYANARGSLIVNNRLGRAWLTDEAVPTRDVSSALADDFTFGSQGLAVSDHSIFTNATPNDHRQSVETYGASRTDGELYNFGVSGQLLTISSNYTFDSILHSKTSGGVNATSFIIGSDMEFIRPLGLRGASGDPISGAPVNCTLYRPDETAMGSFMHGPTDANGDGIENETEGPMAPQGTWKFICTSSYLGNNGTYQITFTYASALTSDVDITILSNIVRFYPNDSALVNVTAAFHTVDHVTWAIANIIPDDEDVTLQIKSYNDSGHGPIVASDIKMNTFDTDPLRSVWYAEFYVTPTIQNYTLHALVRVNITGKPFIAGEQFTVDNTTAAGGGNITFTEGMIATPYIFTLTLSLVLVIMSARYEGGLLGILGLLLSFGAWLGMTRDADLPPDSTFVLILRYLHLIMAFVSVGVALAGRRRA